MWRLRSLVVLGVLVGVLIFGSVLAQGAWYWNAWYWNAWYWNAEGSGEGVDFRTAWNVADDQTDESIDGDEFNYHATIELRVPQGADFTLMAANAAVETVSLIEDPSLECKADGVESEVAYEVEPLENAQGNKVMVWGYRRWTRN